MPLAASPPSDFSFERDVAPYASTMFDSIGAAGLSPDRAAKLQGTLLNGVGDIETQRLKLQEERDQSSMRALQYREGQSALADAQARRDRIAQQAQQVADTHAAVTSIVNSPVSDAQKEQMLANHELQNAGISAANPDVSQIYRIASNAVPRALKPEFTSSERLGMALKGVPVEVMQRGNLDEIGTWAEHYDQAQQDFKQKRELATAQTKEGEEERKRLLHVPLKFTNDEVAGKDVWLDPESTTDAAAIVHTFGTPEEHQKFDALRTDSSDHARANLANSIRLREALKRSAPAVVTPVDRAASLIGPPQSR